MNTAFDAFGPLVAAQSTVSMAVGGFGTIGIQISNTWVGTVTFECTVDDANWQTFFVMKTNSASQVTSTTSNGLFVGSCAGLAAVRARMSAHSSGTADVRLLAVGTGGGAGGSGGGGGGGAVTIADGDDVAEGATTDAAVLDANGTVNAHVRGTVKVLADVWDSVNHWFKVSIQNTTLAVTQSGSWVLSAGTALVGRVSASDETNTIYNGTTALTPKFAALSTSSSGASTAIAAVSSKKLRVTQVVLMANAAVNVKFQSHTAGDITGLLYLAANTGFAPGYDPTGHFETVAGEALDINLSGAQAVGGWLKYIEV